MTGAPAPNAPMGLPGQMFRDLAQQQAAESGQWMSPFSALMGRRTGQIRDMNGPQLQQAFSASGQMTQTPNQQGLNNASLFTALAFR